MLTYKHFKLNLDNVTKYIYIQLLIKLTFHFN